MPCELRFNEVSCSCFWAEGITTDVLPSKHLTWALQVHNGE